MRVGIDGSAFAHRHGDGRFARNAVGALTEVDDRTEYVLHVDPATALAVELPPRAQTRHVALRRGAATGLRVDATRPPLDLLRLAHAASTGGYDAFLFPSLIGWVPTVRVRTVVGLHDAHVERFGAAIMPARRARAAWRLKQAVAVRRAARVFTVSEAARADLGLEEAAIVPEAPDPVFFPRSRDDQAEVRARMGIPPGAPLIVYAAGTGPHKSVETLVDALADLPEAVAVIAGEPIGRKSVPERVRLPGFVDDETLARLLSAATVAVVTSRGEGFGLPAVEAAACGAPVVLSDLPAHRESLGDAASYFPPGDARALATHLRRLVDDEEAREDAARRARERVAALSWRRAGEVLRDLVAEASRARPPR
ncbi:MAG TPA: glycosyltransferase [Solirubrobacteraceae bacterium]|jgi:glycosyltransferase involved in cell wall biosynthesis